MSIAVQAFGNVAVLMGGWSAEREISLRSGHAVLAALQHAGVAATAIDVTRDNVLQLPLDKFDRVFNSLHGRGGEDGVIQAILDVQDMAYTGSNVLASALAMDKYRSKMLWQSLGLPTPSFAIVETAEQCHYVLAQLGLPLAAKPVAEGSSFGISKVETEEQLLPAWQRAAEFGTVMLEQWIIGDEYTVGIVAGQPLPLVRLETPRAFYDYAAKYEADDTRYHCPCDLPLVQEQQIQQLSVDAFNAIGASGWGRMDLMLDSAQQPWLIELNTVPGMTDHSLLPMAAKVAGISFAELVLHILQTTMPQSPTTPDLPMAGEIS